MRNKYFFLLGLLMIGVVQANDLDEQIKAASDKATLVSATADQLQHFKDRVKALLIGESPEWQSLSMQATTQAGFISLYELPNAKQGRGFFAFNPHASHHRLLQAPHGDSDLYTGKIASHLFLEGGFKAAQWNTVKRNISDMAHSNDTYWQAMTQAFAEQYPHGQIIQLHGYDQDTRKTNAGENSDMILSAGHGHPPLWLQQTAHCLKAAFSTRVGLYPFDVNELGATTNVQGQLLQQLGHDGFLHIEMSKDMRRELLDHPEARKLLMSCL